MVASPRQKVIAARFSDEKKAAFGRLAQSRGMSETALLTLLVDTVLGDNPAAGPVPDDEEERATDRMTLRLRPGDRELIDARAAARNMKPSSYCVALIRAHVRSSAPLPTDELNTLKVSLGELSAVGRNLNQISRAVNAGAGAGAFGPLLKDLQGVVRHVDQVRRDTAELIRVNLLSWEAGDG